MRSQILFVAALLSTTTFAQRTSTVDDAAKLAPTNPGTTVAGGTVTVTGQSSMTGSDFINGGVVDAPMVAVVMDRDFRDAIQGNLDRETIERANGEVR
ncbi:MAG: hypothetical protein RL173_3213 [Fibrobacterota bacterium]|jgi:hypothetical protein